MEASIVRTRTRAPAKKPADTAPDADQDIQGAASIRPMVDAALAVLDQDQAENVVTIELAGRSNIADFLVIASGRSTRQVGAMAEHLATALKAAGAARVNVEGLTRCDWVLIDTGDLVVHLFRPEVRAFYNLEKMWGVDLPPMPAARHDPIADHAEADPDLDAVRVIDFGAARH